MPTENLDETAKQILDAASRRFLHYGYGKTTMSEIAQDCNMSTGNLYRYFPSKLDIAEMFVRVLRREQVAKLRAVLLNPSSYEFEMAKGCMPDYGVRFQFVHQGREVDVLLCFGCDILAVYDRGKKVGGEDFDTARLSLAAIVKTLFPKDDAIQALK